MSDDVQLQLFDAYDVSFVSVELNAKPTVAANLNTDRFYKHIHY
jgi:hypothetical protein